MSYHGNTVLPSLHAPRPEEEGRDPRGSPEVRARVVGDYLMLEVSGYFTFSVPLRDGRADACTRALLTLAQEAERVLGHHQADREFGQPHHGHDGEPFNP